MYSSLTYTIESICIENKTRKNKRFTVSDLCSFWSHNNNSLERRMRVLYCIIRNVYKHLDAATTIRCVYSSKNVISSKHVITQKGKHFCLNFFTFLKFFIGVIRIIYTRAFYDCVYIIHSTYILCVCVCVNIRV